MSPPCELQARQAHSIQTAVMKIVAASGDVLHEQCRSWLMDSAGAVAYVRILAGKHQGHYLVLTSRKPAHEDAIARRLQNQLQERPGSPQAV